jgi:hypothetical protein
MHEDKLREQRAECGTRIGDVVRSNGILMLKVKCRRCSKRDGVDIFHYVRLHESESVFSRTHGTSK